MGEENIKNVLFSEQKNQENIMDIKNIHQNKKFVSAVKKHQTKNIPRKVNFKLHAAFAFIDSVFWIVGCRNFWYR